jgi:hypothetical protein
MKIPSIIIAGDSAQWRDVAFQDGLGNVVSSVDYTLTYSFRGPRSPLNLAGTPQGSGWQFNLSTTDSAALNAGKSVETWYWQATAAKTGARLTAGEGTLAVRANLPAMTTAGFDGRSQAEKDLAAVRSEISARINNGASIEYTIGNRSLKREPMTALVEIEQRCLRIVQRERRSQSIANGLGNPGRVGVRFK